MPDQKPPTEKKRKSRDSAEDLKTKRMALKAEAKEAKNAAKETAKLRMQGVVTDATKKVTAKLTGDPSQPEPPWWSGKKGKAQRTPIDRDVIIDTAIAIIDADGYDALTIRRLAAELDTGPATLYWHIAGKDELGELVYDRIMGEVDLPEPDPDNWREQLKELVRDCYRVMLSHNDSVRLSLGRVPMGPNMLRIMEWTFAVTRGAGVPDDVAGYFGDLIGRYIDASVLEETAKPTLGGKELPEAEAIGMIAEYFSSLSPEQFPNLTKMSPNMFKFDNQQRFDLGLEILMRGLDSYISDSTAGA